MRNKKGFTLIELLVVISIIGILSTLAVISLGNARAKSRDARRVSDIKQLQTAMELYFNDENGYPAAASALEIGGTDAKCLGSNGFKAKDACTGTIYMSSVPANPTPAPTGAKYEYLSASPYSTYTLKYTLEAGTGSIPAGLQTATEKSIQ